MTAEQRALQNYACSHCRAVFRTAFHRCPLDGNVLEELVGDPLAGSSFADRYIIEECVGEGGMGRVYRARHQRMSRRFAVKVLFGDHAADSKMRQRLAREAEAASRLSHPNVISVVDFGETDAGLLYLVMDYVDGPTLAQVIERDAPIERDRVLGIAKDCSRGLAHAHAKGLIHRDFKADNVLITMDSGEEVAKIVDFGIAMLNEPSKSRKLTTEGMVLGTPAVMAPEQAVGETVDHRTDLFSLGIVMYEMMAGVLPFDGSPLEIARQNLASRVPKIADRVPGLWVDPELEALAMRLMAKRPDDRPQSAKDVLRSLARIEGENSRQFQRSEALVINEPHTPIPGAPTGWTDEAPTEITPYPHQARAQSANPAAAVGLTGVMSADASRQGRSHRTLYLTAGAITLLVAALVVALLLQGDEGPRAEVTPDAGEELIALGDGDTAADAAPVAPDAAPLAPDAAPVQGKTEAERAAEARAEKERARERREERARKRREDRERKRREREAKRKADAEAKRKADAEVTPKKYSAKFRAVGRRLGRLARLDSARARGLRNRYQIVQNQHALALGNQKLRSKNYRTLQSIDSKVRAALKKLE